jgi:hypothetical protein
MDMLSSEWMWVFIVNLDYVIFMLSSMLSSHVIFWDDNITLFYYSWKLQSLGIQNFLLLHRLLNNSDSGFSWLNTVHLPIKWQLIVINLFYLYCRSYIFWPLKTIFNCIAILSDPICSCKHTVCTNFGLGLCNKHLTFYIATSLKIEKYIWWNFWN